jgi:hypothetical protein
MLNISIFVQPTALACDIPLFSDTRRYIEPSNSISIAPMSEHSSNCHIELSACFYIAHRHIESSEASSMIMCTQYMYHGFCPNWNIVPPRHSSVSQDVSGQHHTAHFPSGLDGPACLSLSLTRLYHRPRTSNQAISHYRCIYSSVASSAHFDCNFHRQQHGSPRNTAPGHGPSALLAQPNVCLWHTVHCRSSFAPVTGTIAAACGFEHHKASPLTYGTRHHSNMSTSISTLQLGLRPNVRSVQHLTRYLLIQPSIARSDDPVDPTNTRYQVTHLNLCQCLRPSPVTPPTHTCCYITVYGVPAWNATIFAPSATCIHCVCAHLCCKNRARVQSNTGVLSHSQLFQITRASTLINSRTPCDASQYHMTSSMVTSDIIFVVPIVTRSHDTRSRTGMHIVFGPMTFDPMALDPMTFVPTLLHRQAQRRTAPRSSQREERKARSRLSSLAGRQTPAPRCPCPPRSTPTPWYLPPPGERRRRRTRAQQRL